MNNTNLFSTRTFAPSMRRCLMGLSLAASVLCGSSLSAQTVSLTTDHYSYLPLEPIVASFSGGPGNPKDWIGIYPPDVEPGPTPSTKWLYVDGTQTSSTGISEGSVSFDPGLEIAGDWVAYFLLNDDYTKAAQVAFRVIDPSQTYVRTAKRSYNSAQPISVSFTNGPGNPKDWIGIYPEGTQPGSGTDSLLWLYGDGTKSGTAGTTEGTLVFTEGLNAPGRYVAYLLQDDDYIVLASEPFEITAGLDIPRILSFAPAKGANNVPPTPELSVTITNGATSVVSNSIRFLLDGNAVPFAYTNANGHIIVSYTTPTFMPSGSSHEWTVFFADSSTTPHWVTNTATFTVAAYRNIQLPAAIYLETFDSTEEGQLPQGWTAVSYSDVTDENLDLQDLNSKSYANWVVVSRDRFTNAFLSYDDHEPTDDYQRVLSVNPLNVVNGKPVNNLATGKFVFNTSGYRGGVNQYAVLYSPDFDLTGKTNVHLSFHSLWEQNQDSMGAVEYSIDQGATWLPIVYMILNADVLSNELGTVDAVATLTASYGSLALYTDPNSGEQKGGTYGSFIGAAVTQDLAPYISGRLDDDRVESKRVELFRLPQADNQPKVRLRFAHAGTDSWYFGVDDVGFYSLAPASPAVQLQYSRSGSELILSWDSAASGFKLESASSLSTPDWTEVSGVSNNSARVPITTGQRFFRLRL